MCMIAYSSQRKMTKEEFENAFVSNNDGAGFAWRLDGKVYISKGYKRLDNAWEMYQSFVPDKAPHAVHFRIGTSGGKGMDMTHPFLVTPTSPVVFDWEGEVPVLFHNGVLSMWNRDILNHTKEHGEFSGNVSDTRFLAGRIAVDGMEAAQEYLYSDKLIILEPKRTIMVGVWIEDNDMFFSNSAYKTRMAYRGTSAITSSKSTNPNAKNYADQSMQNLIDELEEEEFERYFAEAQEEQQEKVVSLLSYEKQKELDIAKDYLDAENEGHKDFTDEDLLKAYDYGIKQANKIPLKELDSGLVAYEHALSEAMNDYLAKVIEQKQIDEVYEDLKDQATSGDFLISEHDVVLSED